MEIRHPLREGAIIMAFCSQGCKWLLVMQDSLQIKFLRSMLQLFQTSLSYLAGVQCLITSECEWPSYRKASSGFNRPRSLRAMQEKDGPLSLCMREDAVLILTLSVFSLTHHLIHLWQISAFVSSRSRSYGILYGVRRPLEDSLSPPDNMKLADLMNVFSRPSLSHYPVIINPLKEMVVLFSGQDKALLLLIVEQKQLLVCEPDHLGVYTLQMVLKIRIQTIIKLFEPDMAG